MARTKTESNHSQDSIRLNKFLSICGIASRRQADALIDRGEVLVNGHQVFELGVRVNPREDRVVVDGQVVRPPHNRVYIMFNKPAQVLTSLADPEGRPTVGEYFSHLDNRIFPVGRLDWDSEGLILLTNDGDFSHRVMHPSEAIPKTYLVKLNGRPSESQLARLKSGVSVIGGRVKAKSVERLPSRGSKKYDWIKVVISEGKNRQVRRMFEKIGFDVKKLQRVAIGSLELGRIKKGQFVTLNERQVERVFHNPLQQSRIRSRMKSKFKVRQ